MIKPKKKLLLIFITFISVFFCMRTPHAILVDGNIGDMVVPGPYAAGSGGWTSGQWGVKISVYSNTGALLKSGIVKNNNFSVDYYTMPKVHKFDQAAGYQLTTNPGTITYDRKLPTNYTEINLKDKLAEKKDGKEYYLLNELLKDIGANTLSNEQKQNAYVIVEPLIYIRETTYVEASYKCYLSYWDNNKYRHSCLHDYKREVSYSSLNSSQAYCECELDTPNGVSKDEYHVLVNGKTYLLSAYEFLNYIQANPTKFETWNKAHCVTGDCYNGVLISLGKSLRIIENYRGNTLTKVENTSDSSILDCIKNKNGGCAIGWYKYSEISPSGKGVLQIWKLGPDGSRIYGASTKAKFRIYNDSGCNEAKKMYDIEVDGDKSIELNAGSYSFKEIQAPEKKLANGKVIKYNIDKTCQNATITSGKITYKSVQNDNQCAFGDGSIYQKIKAYETTYVNENYNKLLDFDNASCDNVEYKTSSTAYCVAGSASNGDYENFNERDLSSYTFSKQLPSRSENAYCSASIEITGPLLQSSSAEAGQLYIKPLDGIGAYAILKFKCYAYDSSSKLIDTKLTVGKPSDFLNTLSFMNPISLSNRGTILDASSDEDIEVELGKEKVVIVDYKFKGLYAENGSGKLNYYSDSDNNICSNCKFLGYGIPSMLNEQNTQTLNIFLFNYDLAGKAKKISTASTDGAFCYYDIFPGIVKNNKLDVTVRSIQVENPFPGKDGNGRTPGKNWNIPYRDAILLDSPNSYGIVPSSGERVAAKYVINLSPTDVNNIRKYNKDNSYDDYNLKCINDGNTCISNYLTTLSEEGILTINDSYKRESFNTYCKENLGAEVCK